MPAGRKPFPVAKARRILEEWLAIAVTKSPQEAPLTAETARAHLESRGLRASRSTLSKYKLTERVEAASREQEQHSRKSRTAETRPYEEELTKLRAENRKLQEQNRALLGQIATMTYNARGKRISEDELMRDMPKPDRSRSRAGQRTTRE